LSPPNDSADTGPACPGYNTTAAWSAATTVKPTTSKPSPTSPAAESERVSPTYTNIYRTDVLGAPHVVRPDNLHRNTACLAGKVLALVAMHHRDRFGLQLPSSITPDQLGVVAPTADAGARTTILA
jgi:hypothetical protein